MASYTRSASSQNVAQISVLAQAKPAIIASPPFNNNGQIETTDSLSERIAATLNFTPPKNQLNAYNNHDVDLNKSNSNNVLKMNNHIEDDIVIQKQNVSNQMRQAMVMAAMVSQQKVRLTAKERLAMTAKKPPTQPTPKPTTIGNSSYSLNQANKPFVYGNGEAAKQNSKSTPLPTLETLLAVQRQLQQHTRQSLNSVPQKLVKQQQELIDSTSKISQIQPKSNDSLQSEIQTPQMQQLNSIHQSSNANSSPSLININQATTNNHYNSSETYEKDLPPLPPSISPSTSTDDSQLNSLESHQSSPATSLVSLPPPPPPLSAYMQQYDEVNACHQSNSSTPTTTCSEISSIKQFSQLPLKLTNNIKNIENAHVTIKQDYHRDSQHHFPQPPPTPNHQKSSETSNFNLELPNHHQTSNISDTQSLPVLTSNNNTNMQQVSHSNVVPLKQHYSTNITQNSTAIYANRHLIQPQLPPPPPPIQSRVQPVQNCNFVQNPSITQAASFIQTQATTVTTQSRPNSEQQVLSSRLSSNFRLPSMLPPPPPPPPFADQPLKVVTSILPSATLQTTIVTNNSVTNVSEGFDQTDSCDLRFPTPPPPDLMLNSDDTNEIDEANIHTGNEHDNDVDEDEDEDFQCKIPTPPPHRTAALDSNTNNSATLEDLQNLRQRAERHFHHQQQIQQQLQQNHHHQSASMFNSSTFSASGLQPPPIFRQQQTQSLTSYKNQPQKLQAPAPTLTSSSVPPQLTVHINNGGGLLSAASNLNHASVNHHHHHHMMMAMATSSSSPSSSSDGDGHSSNSSSSTSGIHSSIDSPSSSNSKLDDFDYSNGKLKRVVSKNHETPHYFETSLKGYTVINSTSNETFATATIATNNNNNNSSNIKPRPALKQKKTVSFSDKVELVACAEEQSEDHLPNPLLARVLAGKLQ